jgi:hypothetical protein
LGTAVDARSAEPSVAAPHAWRHHLASNFDRYQRSLSRGACPRARWVTGGLAVAPLHSS